MYICRIWMLRQMIHHLTPRLHVRCLDAIFLGNPANVPVIMLRRLTMFNSRIIRTTFFFLFTRAAWRITIDHVVFAVLEYPLAICILKLILLLHQHKFVNLLQNTENIQTFLQFLCTLFEEFLHRILFSPTANFVQARHIVMEKE